MSGDRTGSTVHRNSPSRMAHEIMRNGRHCTIDRASARVG